MSEKRKLQTLEHGMLLRSKIVMDNALPELAEIKELVPECLHDRLDKLIERFEDTLCEADIADEVRLLEEYLDAAKCNK